MRRIFVSEITQKELMQKGYTVIPMLSEEEVAYLLKEYEQMSPDDNFAPVGKVYSFPSTALDSNISYKRKANRLIREIFSSRVKELLIDYKIITGGFLTKPPKAGKVVIHRDWTLTDDLSQTVLNFWCPLVDVDETNGTLCIVEGSHKIVPNIESPNTKKYFCEFEDSLKVMAKPIPMKAGECLVFDHCIVHLSENNHSTTPRYVAQFVCVPTEANTIFCYPDKNSPDKRFEVFEVDSEFYIEHSLNDYLNGNIRTNSLGFIENKNRVVSEEEFKELIKNGDTIRRKVYFPEESGETNTSFSFLKTTEPVITTRKTHESKRIFFNEDFQNEFLQKGYSTLSLLSQKEISYILNELENIRPDDNFSPMKSDAINATYHSTNLHTDVDYKLKADNLIREVFTPHIKKIFVDYNVLTCGFVVKTPRKGEFAVHRDWAFTDNFNDINVMIWCPLVGVDETNGTLQLIEGSHKLVPNIECPHTTPFFYQFADILKKYSTPIKLKAGEALLFDNSLLHWSTQNNSSATRYVAQLFCISPEAKPVFYYPDKNAPDKQFEVFEMDNEFFIKHSLQEFMNGTFKAQSLGFIQNTNRIITEEEFLELLENGDKIRGEIYFPEAVAKSNAKVSFLNRIKAMLTLNTLI